MDSTKHTVGRLRASAGMVGTLLVSLALVAVVCLSAGACSDAMGEARALEDEGDLDGAVALYEELLRKEPDNVKALSAAAVDLLLLGRFDEALPLQERVVGLDPADAQTRVELGFNYLNRQERSGDAVRMLEEAVALEPSAKNLTFLAQAQIASGDFADGEKVLRRAIETERGYSYPYSILVKLLEDQGRVEEAGEVVEQASEHGVVVEDSR